MIRRPGFVGWMVRLGDDFVVSKWIAGASRRTENGGFDHCGAPHPLEVA